MWSSLIPGFLIYCDMEQTQGEMGISAIDYELGVAMGMQEPAEKSTEVGVAFWRGFALADLVFYIPVLALGLIGHFKQKNWGRICLAAALGISIYWPVTCLAAVIYAQGAPGWDFPVPLIYWIVLSGIVIWSLWGLWQLSRRQ